jgi:hypothetical protein
MEYPTLLSRYIIFPIIPLYNIPVSHYYPIIIPFLSHYIVIPLNYPIIGFSFREAIVYFKDL